MPRGPSLKVSPPQNRQGHLSFETPNILPALAQTNVNAHTSARAYIHGPAEALYFPLR